MAWSKSMVPKEKQMMLDHDIPYFQITILGYFGCPSFLDPLSSDCWLSHDHKLVSLSHCCPSSSHSHLGLLWFNLYICFTLDMKHSYKMLQVAGKCLLSQAFNGNTWKQHLYMVDVPYLYDSICLFTGRYPKIGMV